ncbi:MAG: hypothetical protein AAF533_15550 [Acidobacteriota bacterium]
MATCWNCDLSLGEPRTVSRDEICDSCQVWIRSCKNCHFWSETSRSCEEPAAEWVHDREHVNFCDFFALRSDDGQSGSGSDSGGGSESGGRSAFDALFS